MSVSRKTAGIDKKVFAVMILSGAFAAAQCAQEHKRAERMKEKLADKAQEKKIVRRSGKKPSGKKPANTDADQH
jgi:hypothetical protein